MQFLKSRFIAFVKLPRWYTLPLAAMLIFRLVTIFSIDLIDDEAYHWTWAKNLRISYFDHPGIVGWAIWPFIKVFGDSAPAIRTAGLLMFLSILYLVYLTGKEIFDQRTGLLASLLLFFIPLWGVASLGTLPDVPLGLFWILIVYLFWQSVRPDEHRWSVKKSWLLIGIAMGLGMNSKLSCCLVGLGMGFFLLTSKEHRRQLLTPWPWVASLVTFLMMAPIFVWNAQNGWPSFIYQFVRRHGEDAGTNWTRWLQFWSYQWLFMSPGVYIGLLLTLAFAVYRWRDLRFRFLFCLSTPALMLFYYQALKAAFKPHWSGPSYLILLLGAVYLFWNGAKFGKVQILKPTSVVFASFTAFFLALMMLLYVPLFTPIIPRVYAHFNDPSTWQPHWDFSNEFYGWKQVGAEVLRRQAEIEQQTGQRPYLGAQRYELISQLSWGTLEKVWAFTDETNQFFFDQLKDRPLLIGGSALIVNNDKYPRDPRELARFATCEKSEFPIYRSGILARTFYIYYCRDFQGI